MINSLKNLWRRKTRTILTILGIVVGIIALTVLGSLAARMSERVRSNTSWYVDGIAVRPGYSSSAHSQSRGYFETAKAEEVESVPGVKYINLDLTVPVEVSGEGVSAAADGTDLSRPDERIENLKLSSGRHLEEGDRGKTVLGSNFSERMDAELGDTVDLNGIDFEVVGVLEATLSVPDRLAFVAIEDAKEIFTVYFPGSQIGDIANSIRAFPEEGVDPEALAETIEEQIGDVETTTPAEAEVEIAQFTLIFNAIILGVALIALIVGGLSVINTMVMSVSERKREIGVKKAIGADTSAILNEIMLESSMIGFLGGVIGVLLGLLIILPLNTFSARQDVTIFTITPLVIIGPVIFATVLGIIAGFFPALRAARLDPVDALRED